MNLFPIWANVTLFSAFTCTTPAYSANCQTLFDNATSISAKNDSDFAEFGALGSLLLSNELSEPENFIQSELKKIDYANLFHEMINNQIKDKKYQDYHKNDCLIRVNFKKLTVEYSFRTDIKVEVDIFRHENGILVFEKTEVINENIGGIPESRSPRRKFKMVNAKYIETTPPRLTNEEAFEKFKPDFIKAMSKIFSKIYRKYQADF